MGDALPIWTIGHSSHSAEAFLDLLAAERIEVVVDVRSYPFSRFAPQFNRDEIAAALTAAGLSYLFMGEELGGRPARPEHYDPDGHALYGAMAGEGSFQGAINRVMGGAKTHRIALMCSEGRPWECHRRLLVGKVLTGRGASLFHILPDASLSREDEVNLGGKEDGQPALFGDEEPVWRSTQSVSRRRRLNASSAA